MKPHTPRTDATETLAAGFEVGFNFAENLPTLLTLCRRVQIDDRELDHHLDRIKFPPHLSDEVMVAELQKFLHTANVNPHEHPGVIAAFNALLRRRAQRSVMEGEALEQAKAVEKLVTGIPEMVVLATSTADPCATLPVGTDVLIAVFMRRSLNTLEKQGLVEDMARQYDTLEKAHAALEAARQIQTADAFQKFAFLSMLEAIKQAHEQRLMATLQEACEAMRTFLVARDLQGELDRHAQSLNVQGISHGPMTGSIKSNCEILKRAVEKSLSWWKKLKLAMTKNGAEQLEERSKLLIQLMSIESACNNTSVSFQGAFEDLKQYKSEISPLISKCDEILRTTNPAICTPNLVRALHESREWRLKTA